MPRNYTYIRKYIILKNDYTNILGLEPKGYAKIEARGTKGILNICAENCQQNKDYNVYLLKDEKGEVQEYSIGRIITDERGKTSTNINLNLRDLELKGFSIDKIDAILIRKGIYILLGGYIDKDKGTIDRYIHTLIQQEENVQKENVDEIHQPQDIEKDLEENIQTSVEREEKEFEYDITDTEETKCEPNNQAPIDNTKPIEYEETNTQDEMESYKSLEYMRRLNHKKQMTNYILSILRFFPYVQPLKLNLYGYSWWRIDDSGTDSYKGFLPYFNYLMCTNYKYSFLNNSTTCFNLIKKYGHYLFGMYKEGKETKYYMYGIPGKFVKEEHPFRGITGFNTWYESTDGLGYWILYIDPMTGEVIYPLNPMVPAY